MNTTTAFLAITLSLLAHGVSQIPYQGRITDNTGKPLADGPATITFSLHNAATSGAQIWGPFTRPVNLVSGRFATNLGPLDESDRDIGEALSVGGRFLSLSVGTDAPLPRQEILPAPRALVADAANRLTGPIVLQSDTTHNERSHRIYLKELNSSDALGFSIAYAGQPSATFDGQPFNFVNNSFNILRHEDSAVGTPVLTVARETGKMIVNGGGTAPTSSFEIAGPVQTLSATDGIGMFSVGIHDDLHIAMSRSTIQAYDGNTPETLGLNPWGNVITKSIIASEALVADTVSARGQLFAEGLTDDSSSPVQILATNRNSGIALVGGVSGQHIAMDRDDIQARNGDSASPLYLNFYGGEVRIATGSNGGDVVLGNSSSTVSVTGTFSNTSDKHVKEDFAPVDSEAVLDRLVDLPLSSWRYIGSKGRRHVGPVSQDFHAAFDDLLNLNSDDTTIAPLDEAGVAFASIQALHGKVESDQHQIEALKRENASLEQRLEQLEAIVLQLASDS